VALVLLVPAFALARQRPTAEPRAAISDEIVAGSGPYFGNLVGLSVEAVPQKLDLDLTYFVATDQAEALHHVFSAAAFLQVRRDATLVLDADATPPSGSPGNLFWSAGGRVGVELSSRRFLIEPDFGAHHFSVEQAGQPRGWYNQFDFGARAALFVDATTFHGRITGYFYDQDLATIGILQLPRGGGGSFGVEGLPTRPPLFDLRLGVRHRFEEWRAGVTLGFTQYVEGQGSLSLLSLRVSRRVVQSLRALGGLSLQSDHSATTRGGQASSQGALLVSLGIEIEL
jgi:hypothetical protein